MSELYWRLLRVIRDRGFNVLVLPSAGDPAGEAFIVKHRGGHTPCITIHGAMDSALWLFVLFHELAHHLLGHTRRWTSEPVWLIEKQADDMALKMIRSTQPDLVAACELASQLRIRGLMQGYIDDDIWNHVDLGVADWAGCVVPARMRTMLEDEA